MALFTKRHYVYLASIFRDEMRIARHNGQAENVANLIRSFAKALQNDNPAFDVGRFILMAELDSEALAAKILRGDREV